MRDRAGISFRVAYGGHAREFHIGRTGQAVIAVLLGLFLVVVTHSIYDSRESAARARELHALRQRVSEQNLTLYNLYAKFESLETEVERLRMVDTRVRSLVNLTESLRPGTGKRVAAAGVGGIETPQDSVRNRLDRLLDLRLGQLKQDVLVDITDLDRICEKLDTRRIFLESLPSLWPVRGALSSGYGIRTSPFTETKVFHHGLDIIARVGTPVRAAAGGKVVNGGYEALLGNFVTVDHGYGYQTVYGHLSERLVSIGDVVERGETIGKVGTTGRTTGPHLHYEVHVNGLPVNPVRFVS
ncbi:MAG: M23 family metallopeptidase [Deltaproteobacteria bacterium]|nr:M23 family metallopeptidase [Deltaproteobacteria bacterium]